MAVRGLLRPVADDRHAGVLVREIGASLSRIFWHLVRHYAMAILSVLTIAGLGWLLGFSIAGVIHGRVR